METDLLLQLCQYFSNDWSLIWDRFNSCKPEMCSLRTVEQLKLRYFQCSQKILQYYKKENEVKKENILNEEKVNVNNVQKDIKMEQKIDEDIFDRNLISSKIEQRNISENPEMEKSVKLILDQSLFTYDIEDDIYQRKELNKVLFRDLEQTLDMHQSIQYFRKQCGWISNRMQRMIDRKLLLKSHEKLLHFRQNFAPDVQQHYYQNFISSGFSFLYAFRFLNISICMQRHFIWSKNWKWNINQ